LREEHETIEKDTEWGFLRNNVWNSSSQPIDVLNTSSRPANYRRREYSQAHEKAITHSQQVFDSSYAANYLSASTLPI